MPNPKETISLKEVVQYFIGGGEQYTLVNDSDEGPERKRQKFTTNKSRRV